MRQDHLSRYEGKPGEIPERRSAQRYSLKPGAAVSVVPRLPGCRVNPPAATAEFWENFHRRSFRVMAAPGAPGYAEGHHTGIVQFFVGPLLVGEARMAFTIGREKAHPISNTATLAADTFDAVGKWGELLVLSVHGTAAEAALTLAGPVALGWTGPAGTGWNSYRGTIPAGMMASRPVPYDHVCLETLDFLGDGPTSSLDPGLPAAGTAFYYLVTERNDCGEGVPGTDWLGAPVPSASPCVVGP